MYRFQPERRPDPI